MLASARRAISYPNPDRSDRPDIPAHFINLINALDLDAPTTFGTLAARPASPGHAMQFYWGTDTSLLYLWDGAAWKTVSAAPLTVVEASLSADVTMTNANQFYDGPSVSLPAGTHYISGTVTMTDASNTVNKFTAKLWDGTTVESSSEQTMPATQNHPQSITLIGSVTPGSTTTYKISVASTDAGALILAAAPDNGAGNNAGRLVAVKIG